MPGRNDNRTSEQEISVAVLRICADTPDGEAAGVGKKSGPSRSAKRFRVGLKLPFKLYVASGMVPPVVHEHCMIEFAAKVALG